MFKKSNKQEREVLESLEKQFYQLEAYILTKGGEVKRLNMKIGQLREMHESLRDSMVQIKTLNQNL